MAPRKRVSELDSRVTIYEPPAAPSTPLKRARITRSLTAGSSPIVKSLKEEDSDSAEDAEEEEEELDVKPSPAKKPSKPKPFVNSLSKPHPAPKRWKEQLAVLQEQRKTVGRSVSRTDDEDVLIEVLVQIVAAVDLMGCEQGGRTPDEKPPSDKVGSQTML